jgi:hypothetical protein
VSTPQVQWASAAAEHWEQAQRMFIAAFASRCVKGMQPKVLVALHL